MGGGAAGAAAVMAMAMTANAPPVRLAGPLLSCQTCGHVFETLGQWDEDGRPWAMIGEAAWVSVDHHGRAAFRCVQCEPQGAPLVIRSAR
jgi:hypothetical protein